MTWLDRVRALFGPATAKAAEGMDRRAFIRMFSAGVVGAAALDVEQLLWTPGQLVTVAGAERKLREFVVTGRVARGNRLASPDWLAKEYLRTMENNIAIAKRVNRAYDKSFRDENSFRVGDVFTIAGVYE